MPGSSQTRRPSEAPVFLPAPDWETQSSLPPSLGPVGPLPTILPEACRLHSPAVAKTFTASLPAPWI